MSGFIVNPALSQVDLWLEIEITQGCVSSVLECVLLAEGGTDHQKREALGALHMVKQSVDQLGDPLKCLEPLIKKDQEKLARYDELAGLVRKVKPRDKPAASEE